jgi:hypothetical protein
MGRCSCRRWGGVIVVGHPRDARAAVVPTGIGTAAFYGVPLGAFVVAAIIAGYIGYESMHPAAPPQVEAPAASTPPAEPPPVGTAMGTRSRIG